MEKYVTEKEFKNDSFMVDFCENYENQNIVFSTCTVKIFYKLLIEKLFQYPVSNTFWCEKLNLEHSEIFIKRWNVLWESHKPPEIVELDTMLYLLMKKCFKLVNIGNIFVMKIF